MNAIKIVNDTSKLNECVSINNNFNDGIDITNNTNKNSTTLSNNRLKIKYNK